VGINQRKACWAISAVMCSDGEQHLMRTRHEKDEQMLSILTSSCLMPACTSFQTQAPNVFLCVLKLSLPMGQVHLRCLALLVSDRPITKLPSSGGCWKREEVQRNSWAAHWSYTKTCWWSNR